MSLLSPEICDSSCGSRELLQEAHVVLEKDLEVIDAVLQHGEAVDAHAEGEAADLLRVVIDKAVDGRIDHAGAEELDPARAFAFRANASARGIAAAAAENAGDVEFHGWLGEREIAWAKARFYARSEELLHEIFDGASEIAEGDVRVHSEAFDLMEHEGMRGVGIIAAVDLAWDDDAHGRLLLLHGANLHGRGVGAQEERRRSAFGQVDVERVHVVADRMELRDVQRFEVVVRRFNLRAFHNGEANGEENVLEFLQDLANQVMRANGMDDS